jgi:hypothetical protein
MIAVTPRPRRAHIPIAPVAANDICLMSSPPRGKVHMATDNAEYRGARPTMCAESTLAFRSRDLRGC